MTHIEQMIQDMCPNGVEWKTLGEVAMRNKGMNITAAQMKKIENINGNIRIFAAGSTKVDALESDIPASSIIRVPSIIVKSRGNIGFEYYDQPFTHKNEMWSYSNFKGVDIKFVYYYLQNLVQLFQQKARANSVKLPQLCVADTDSFEIPLPPLEIQKKIVECLDKFSALAAELQAELQKRRTQYEYYRTRLLTPPHADSTANSTDDCNWEWKTLGDICVSIKDGMHNLPVSSLEETDFPIISAQNIYDNKIDYVAKRYVDQETYNRENKRTKVEVGDILLTIVATIGRSAVVKEDRPVLLQRSVCVLKPHKNIVPEFLKYSLDTNRVQSYMIANAHGAAQAGLYLNQVEQIKIPVPPFAEQQRIADLLDRFDKLITSMEEGLPAEMDRQQKRYEYYRDLLLTFDRKAV